MERGNQKEAWDNVRVENPVTAGNRQVTQQQTAGLPPRPRYCAPAIVLTTLCEGAVWTCPLLQHYPLPRAISFQTELPP